MANSGHMWVSMKYTPLKVSLNIDGSLAIGVDNDTAIVAEEQALRGCWFCHTPLNLETFGSECDPEVDIAVLQNKNEAI